MNISWSRTILSQLYAEGVRDIIVCAGARNSPLVAVLARTTGLNLISFFEERSASFYALGVARRTGRPVAIATTSGTACAELLPAAIEAFHTGVPLVLLTADRPRRLRGSGAPQAIDQIGLFGKFVDIELDLEAGETFSLEPWGRRSPIHINVCFDEPLLDEPLGELRLEGEDTRSPFSGTSAFPVSAGSEWATLRLTKFLRGQGPLMVIVGTLETEREREAVTHFLTHLRAPVYLESTSGLRERDELGEIDLRSGDRHLAWALKKGLIGRVLRIGGVPTVRIWRDLDDPASTIDVLSLTPLPFAGLSRGEMICTDISAALENLPSRELKATSDAAAEIIATDRSRAGLLLGLFEQEPSAEPSLFYALSKTIPENALVYVGNSLPIREWDLAAARTKRFAIEANRGVNGIDGQISTFLGLAYDDRENWAVLGDLTTLYDLAGPWPLLGRDDLTVRIVVVNNGGGKIFSRLFRDPLFENAHGLEFSHWAKMWGLGYQRWTEVPEVLHVGRREVIEVVPDADATQRFWEGYEALWR